MRYSTPPKKENMFKDIVFCFFNKTWWYTGKKLVDTATKKWIDAAKTASKRVVQKQKKQEKI